MNVSQPLSSLKLEQKYVYTFFTSVCVLWKLHINPRVSSFFVLFLYADRKKICLQPTNIVSMLDHAGANLGRRSLNFTQLAEFFPHIHLFSQSKKNK